MAYCMTISVRSTLIFVFRCFVHCCSHTLFIVVHIQYHEHDHVAIILDGTLSMHLEE